MITHFWEYIHEKDGVNTTLELAVYSSIPALRRGALRHSRNFFKLNAKTRAKDTRTTKTCGALCRSWIETEIPVSRIFITSRSSIGIITHEILHAALHAERVLSENQNKPFNEERAARLAESFMNDIHRLLQAAAK